MKKIILIILLISLISCNEKKSYEEYDENDFYEVQGIIDYVHRTSNLFDSSHNKNIGFTYFLDREIPKSSFEKNLEMIEVQNGYPLVVLVHKDDENISFFGRVGILDNLNDKEQYFLKEHIRKEMEKLKGKVHKGLYDEIVKDTIQNNNLTDKIND